MSEAESDARFVFPPAAEDWPTFGFGWPLEDVVAYGPSGLARALAFLGERGYRAHVNADDGFCRSTTTSPRRTSGRPRPGC